ncbi:MAG: rRNA biogenesis protein rrp36 [Vezdaea aestivalis]|nr:MAG: rRNA biogenesis protein rrp36 [Vezdaea aestivalis]
MNSIRSSNPSSKRSKAAQSSSKNPTIPPSSTRISKTTLLKTRLAPRAQRIDFDQIESSDSESDQGSKSSWAGIKDNHNQASASPSQADSDSPTSASGSEDSDSASDSEKTYEQALQTLPFSALLSTLPPPPSPPSSSSAAPPPDPTDKFKKRSKPPTRPSKHAPTALPSTRAVGRARTILAAPSSSRALDPRFSPLSGRYSASAVRANYAFLQDYRKDEIKALKRELKGTQGEGEGEELKRGIESRRGVMEGVEGKEVEDRVRRGLREEERRRVGEGKGVWWEKRGVVREKVKEKREEGWGVGKKERAEGKREKRREGRVKKREGRLERRFDR